MFEAIALLCQVAVVSPNTVQIESIQKAQAQCQRNLVQCVESSPRRYERWETRLAECMVRE